MEVTRFPDSMAAEVSGGVRESFSGDTPPAARGGDGVGWGRRVRFLWYFLVGGLPREDSIRPNGH